MGRELLAKLEFYPARSHSVFRRDPLAPHVAVLELE